GSSAEPVSEGPGLTLPISVGEPASSTDQKIWPLTPLSVKKTVAPISVFEPPKVKKSNGNAKFLDIAALVRRVLASVVKQSEMAGRGEVADHGEQHPRRCKISAITRSHEETHPGDCT